MTRKIETKDVAKIARKILKEAFPGLTFSVKSENSTHTPVLRIQWQDGPTEQQVEGYLDRLCGSYYDCSGIDHRRKSRNALMNGESVSFQPWMISYTRSYSEQAVARAVQAYSKRFPALRDEVGVQEYLNGQLTLKQRPGASHSVQSEIRQALVKRTQVFGLPSLIAQQIHTEDSQPESKPKATDWDNLVSQVLDQVASQGIERVASIIEAVKPADFGVTKTDELKRQVMRNVLRAITPTTLTIVN